MKLTVEQIIADDTSMTVSLRIRRNLNNKEKLYNLSEFFRGSKNNISYRKGRVCYMTVDLNYLDKHSVTIGDDINDYDDIEYSMMTLESTNRMVFDEEGLAYNVKMNPTTMTPIYHEHKPIYHSTFLIPTVSYSGDILL